jgi:hypothetical protein
VAEVQDIVIEKGVTVHRYERGTVRVQAPRDITLKEWDAPFQKFLANIERGKAVSRSAT